MASLPVVPHGMPTCSTPTRPSLSVVSPFERACPSDNYLARQYGIVTRVAPIMLSDAERAVDDDLAQLLALVEKHAALWADLPTLRVTSERAGMALARTRSTVLALTDALHAHEVARMCAVVYGRNLGALAEAFCAPAPPRQGAPEATAPAVTLQQCADADRVLFQRGLSRVLTGIRRLWVGGADDPHIAPPESTTQTAHPHQEEDAVKGTDTDMPPPCDGA
ncbi:hypothetical protein psal_cds_686 [Pandoravirus salinus]|uniref:Uncharacterized protein n=1 Tax=Pandoravirus salinus TaxID=1349410 RepID=S4W319_9VIRU|nr:hypothetical protein psal_cds_686 [Pandoravirus salinus]AGO84625.1 hypothetical protein psal_cds_686 [Pandoravirus salinus]